MNKYKLILLLLVLPQILTAQIKISNSDDGTKFPLVSNKSASLYYDDNDLQVVKKTVSLLADDIHRVTGKNPKIVYKNNLSKYTVIVGTINHSCIIDDLIEKGKLDVSKITNDGNNLFIKL